MICRRFRALGFFAATAAAGLLGSNAAAATGNSIKIESRFDYVKSDNDTKKTRTRDSAAFQNSTLNMYYQGAVDKDLFYYFVWSPYSPFTTTDPSGIATTQSGYSITKMLSPEMSLSIGNNWAGVAGWENYMYASDVYQYSTTVFLVPRYGLLPGLSANYTIANQKLIASVGNADPAAPNNKLAYSLTWFGNVMNGMLLPYVSYMRQNTSSAVGVPSYSNNFYNISLMAMVPYASVSLDYIVAEFESNSIQLGGTNITKADSQKEMAVRIQHTGANWRPMLKYFSEKSQPDSVATKTSTGLTLAVEYYPAAHYRYHIAYTQNSIDYVSAETADTKTSKIFIGWKGMFDVN